VHQAGVHRLNPSAWTERSNGGESGGDAEQVFVTIFPHSLLPVVPPSPKLRGMYSTAGRSS
jgi:hypothetical protein